MKDYRCQKYLHCCACLEAFMKVNETKEVRIAVLITKLTL